MADPVAKLTIDPDGTPVARTMAYPVLRDWPERTVSIVRQDFVPTGGGWHRSVSRPYASYPAGALRLMLSEADRVWIVARLSAINGGHVIRVQWDSTVAGEYADVMLAGREVPVGFERLFVGRLDFVWLLSLPIIEGDEAG